MANKTVSALLFVFCAATACFAAADESASTYRDIQKTFGFVPAFVRRVPRESVAGAWTEFKSLRLSDDTALPTRLKSLISLAVSSQIPCANCVYFDTRAAKLDGEGDRPINEAVNMAAITRHWSTFLNGIQMNETQFRSDTDQVMNTMRQRMARGPAALNPNASAKPEAAAPQAPAVVNSPATAYEDIRVALGSVPAFLQQFPPEGIVGAWKEFKGLELNADTALTAKQKELIGLAVASQVPCRYCAYFHTEAAKLNGASDREIREAVAVAALARHEAALFGGFQVDERAFRNEADRMLKKLYSMPTHAPRAPASASKEENEEEGSE